MAICIILRKADNEKFSSSFLPYLEDQLFQYVNTFVESTMQINGGVILPLLFHSLAILLQLSSINGNPVTAVPFLFELISQKVIDINATDVTAAFTNDAKRKDNDMQIAHVQTYVIAQEYQLLSTTTLYRF